MKTQTRKELNTVNLFEIDELVHREIKRLVDQNFKQKRLLERRLE